MGDSTCLLHGFSYASAIPNESKQGNPMHALGESISFGRFMTESISWEKWSSFSSSPHKKYVEEAERYAQPGSVAEKKAFFEAHYKRIAAQKAAAAAAAQTDNAIAKIESDVEEVINTKVELDEKIEGAAIEDGGVNGDKQYSVDLEEISKEGEHSNITEIEGAGESRISVTGSEIIGTPQMEMPLLKHNNSVATDDTSSAESKKKSDISCLKSSIRRKTWKVPCTPASRPLATTPTTTTTTTTPYFRRENNVGNQRSTLKSNNTMNSTDQRGSSSKSLRELIDLVPIKEPDKESFFASKKKDFSTPLRTPFAGTTKGVSKIPAATPLTDSRRLNTPSDPSAARGSKTSGPKWHILSSVSSKSVTAYRNKLQSPCVSTPFTLRTEERAAKRKQKLEEKFNANAVPKARQQNKLKEKAGNELRRLSCTFCFKARPLPDFYKERENSVKKITPVARPQTVVLGRSNSYKKQGTTSMPPPPPPPKTSKNPPRKKVITGSKAVTPSIRVAPENKCPNIQPSKESA